MFAQVFRILLIHKFYYYVVEALLDLSCSDHFFLYLFSFLHGNCIVYMLLYLGNILDRYLISLHSHKYHM